MVFKSFTRKKIMASVIAEMKAAKIPSFQKCSFVVVLWMVGFSEGLFKSLDIKYTPKRDTSNIGEIAVPEKSNIIIG
jgi:hypothetical protein